jgi:hypothetical protein
MTHLSSIYWVGNEYCKLTAYSLIVLFFTLLIILLDLTGASARYTLCILCRPDALRVVTLAQLVDLFTLFTRHLFLLVGFRLSTLLHTIGGYVGGKKRAILADSI